MSDGHCTEGARCVCGGDLPSVRAGCHYWRASAPKQAQETSLPPQGAASLLPALIDAAMEVIGQHDAWARQMPAGEFDDPLADAITKLHKATEAVGIARDIAAASPAPAPQEPAEPMDWPLPCDVTVGSGTHRKGTSLGTLVARMRMLHREAFGDPPSPEEAARNLAELQGCASPAPGELGASAVSELNDGLGGSHPKRYEGGRIMGGCSLHDAEKPELCQKHLQRCPEPRTVDCCGVVDEHDIVECHRCGRQWTVPCNFDEDYS